MKIMLSNFAIYNNQKSWKQQILQKNVALKMSTFLI